MFEPSILVGDSNKEVFDNLEIITIFNKVLDRGSSESLAVDLGQLVTSFEFDFFVTNIENFGFNITIPVWKNHLIIGGVNAGREVVVEFVYDIFNKSFDGRRMWGLLNLTYESDSDKIL